MIDTNINITTGETIYLAHGEFSDRSVSPYVATACFNLADAFTEMVKQKTLQDDGSYLVDEGISLGANTSISVVVDIYKDSKICLEYDFIAFLVSNNYLVVPNQRIIELGCGSQFTIQEQNINPVEDKQAEIAQREYEELMGYC
jgi:hypothetical protein